ncbi:MAG: hypothetical protein J6U01_01245, partial [Clostridia bacterium]|nr:hypothetical protein [Clostridia bacterium]
PTAEPTATPTAEATATVAPTQEPVQRVGYAVTIGDGAYVRNWPSSMSVIDAELPPNKVVYVSGQTYVDGVAWHEVRYDGVWGYVRADMLRMMSESEVMSYLDQMNTTPAPTVEITTAPYNGEALSSYGYVSSENVNFRDRPSRTNSIRLAQLKRYAFCLILGSEEVNGETWYRVNYNGQTGYIVGEFFYQMTLDELDEFLNSSNYTQGIVNNAAATAQPAQGGTVNNTGKGSASGIVSAEDQKVDTWVNPNSGIEVSYEPFDPFATPEPLKENTEDVPNKEYLDSLTADVKNGKITAETLKTTLEVYYKDSADKDQKIADAIAYIESQTGTKLTEATPTPEIEPLATETVEYPQEQSGGSALGWILGGLAIVGAGGGYYWYATTQRKRQAAQRAAQKKAQQQRAAQNAAKTGQTAKPQTGASGETAAVPAQNAARVRTGTYTNQNGTVAPKPSESAESAPKAYGKTTENPYARYTSSGEEDAKYTASFKPEEPARTNTRRRTRTDRDS